MRRELSQRYCAAIRDHVIVMTKTPPGEPGQKTCLSSHLCAADARLCCANMTRERCGDAEFFRNELPRKRRK